MDAETSGAYFGAVEKTPAQTKVTYEKSRITVVISKSFFFFFREAKKENFEELL